MRQEGAAEALTERQTGKEADAFVEEARRILKAEMVRRGFTFKRLAAVLNAIDDRETESTQTLINKVNRGRFSFAFLLRVGRAMGVSNLDIAPLRDSSARDAVLPDE